MTRQTNTLSAVAVRNAQTSGQTTRLYDGGGMYLEVAPSGSKIWRLKYRRLGKEKRYTIGPYPTISLAEARKRRDEAKRMLADGLDPSGEKRLNALRERTAGDNTFEMVAREWLERVYSSQVSDSHFIRNRRRLELYTFPYIGKQPVSQISPPEILDCLRKIEARGHVETANRVKVLCGQVFRYAVAIGRAERDITADLRGALRTHRAKHHAAIIEPAELAKLLDAIESYCGQPTTRAALLMNLHVFVRPGELRKARWQDIDLESGVWSFVASKTATPHIVPLSKQVQAMLKELHQLNGRSEFAFPSTRSRTRPMSDATLTAALKTLGYAERMSAHGARATARTLLNEKLGYRRELLELQLAHAVKDSNGRAYDRTTFIDERREMMQRWSDYLDSLTASA